MLAQLLSEINAGGSLETGALAERLGTTPQLVEAMLGHLQRAGRVLAYTGCSDGCLGCNLKESCSGPDRSAPRLWQSVPGE